VLQSKANQENIMDIRPSPLAGRWYPGNPNKLADSVDLYIQNAELPALEGQVLAIISPHAGHQYSGPVAGYAFAAVQGLESDLVVILSPYHQYHSGALISTDHEAYQTPLGTVTVDVESLGFLEQALMDQAGLTLDRVRNDQEHAVEILLPFFQRTFQKDFQLLPIMIRDQSPDLMQVLGSILAELITSKSALLTASSDLSHFHSADKARQLDQTIINAITSLQPENLYEAEKQGAGSACGLGALAAVIWAAQKSGPIKAHQLNYAHSGDITGDHSRVVGYTSAVITQD
jgi:AmmeMemoRadiSam system protein B